MKNNIHFFFYSREVKDISWNGRQAIFFFAWLPKREKNDKQKWKKKGMMTKMFLNILDKK